MLPGKSRIKLDHDIGIFADVVTPHSKERAPVRGRGPQRSPRVGNPSWLANATTLASAVGKVAARLA